MKSKIILRDGKEPGRDVQMLEFTMEKWYNEVAGLRTDKYGQYI